VARRGPVTISKLTRNRTSFQNLELAAHQDLNPIRIVCLNFVPALKARDYNSSHNLDSNRRGGAMADP